MQKSAIFLACLLGTSTVLAAENHGEVTMLTTGYVGSKKSCDGSSGGGPKSFNENNLQDHAFEPGMKSGKVYVATAGAKKGKPKWLGCTLKTDDPEFAGIDFIVDDKTGGRDVVDINYKNNDAGCAAMKKHKRTMKFRITNCAGSRGQQEAKRKERDGTLAQNGGIGGAPEADKPLIDSQERTGMAQNKGSVGSVSTAGIKPLVNKRAETRAPKKTTYRRTPASTRKAPVVRRSSEFDHDFTNPLRAR